MKTTTKIVLSLILFLFLLNLSVIIAVSFIDADKYERRYIVHTTSVSQENLIAIDVASFRTIRIDKEESNEVKNLNVSGTIRISPANDQETENKLLLPEELLKSTDITSSDDTLIIRLKPGVLYEQYVDERKGKFFLINDINYFVHTNTVDVICNMAEIKVDVRNITTEKINIHTYGNVEIDSCRVEFVEPDIQNNSGRFLLKNSQVNELRIDLDKIGRAWQIENCAIEVENLTGSGKHNVVLTNSEAKIMNWHPKNKDAQLTVTLKGDTASVLF